MGIHTQWEEAVILSASSAQGQRIQFSSAGSHFHFSVSWSSCTSTCCWLFPPTWPRSPWHLAVWEGLGGYDWAWDPQLYWGCAFPCSHCCDSTDGAFLASYSYHMALTCHYGKCLPLSACPWSGWVGFRGRQWVLMITSVSLNRRVLIKLQW